MKRPLKVLHIITRLILGGAQENTLLTVIGQQRNPDFEVTLLSGIDEGPEGNLHEKASSEGVNLVLTPNLIRAIRPLTDLRAFFDLYRFIRRGGYDIVHTHSSKAGILGRIAARLAGVPVVVHTLHSLVFHEYQERWKNWLYILLKRFCAPLTDALISVNEKTTQGALAAGVGHPEQYETIYSGMVLEPFLEAGKRWTIEEAKRSIGIPENAPVVGKIARLFPLKGHDKFFDMAEEIARQNSDVRFLLVGDGPLRNSLAERAGKIFGDDRVKFAGLIPPEEIPRYIQAMDVVVHTSLREGIARVLPQACAVEKPVVTFALDGAPEVVRNDVSGYLIPPMDTDEMAGRVLELLDQPEKRRAFGEAGSEFVEANFRIEHMVKSINDVYFRLVENLPC